ncbi:MAG: ketopantoate reductase family protein [archaeon]
MTKKRISIGLIGAGSIGSLFGAYLAKIQKDKSLQNEVEISMSFFCRSAHANKINKRGLKLETKEGIEIVPGIKAYTTPQDFLNSVERNHTSSESNSLLFDYLFLTTKCYDIKSAINQYKAIINRTNWFIILQNGIGNEEIVHNLVPKIKIIRMITTNGALLEKPGHVVHTGEGITKLGVPKLNSGYSEASKVLDHLQGMLQKAGLKSKIVDNINKECWEKVFINIGINAFGALTQLRNGELLDIKGIKQLMKRAIEEAKKIASRKNISLTEKNFAELTFDVARKTATNLNSMLQDINKGNPTEIDFMNGRIVTYADDLGVEVPVNKTLTYLIKGLEYSYLNK